jgi:hypothetical protein
MKWRVGQRVRLTHDILKVGEIIRLVSPRVTTYEHEHWIIIRWDGHDHDRAHKTTDVVEEEGK